MGGTPTMRLLAIVVFAAVTCFAEDILPVEAGEVEKLEQDQHLEEEEDWGKKAKEIKFDLEKESQASSAADKQVFRSSQPVADWEYHSWETSGSLAPSAFGASRGSSSGTSSGTSAGITAHNMVMDQDRQRQALVTGHLAGSVLGSYGAFRAYKEYRQGAVRVAARLAEALGDGARAHSNLLDGATNRADYSKATRVTKKEYNALEREVARLQDGVTLLKRRLVPKKLLIEEAEKKKKSMERERKNSAPSEEKNSEDEDSQDLSDGFVNMFGNW